MIRDGISDTRISNEGNVTEEDSPEPFHRPNSLSWAVPPYEKILELHKFCDSLPNEAWD